MSMEEYPFKKEFYRKQREVWPGEGKHILCQHDDQSIIVYQAYNQKIADQLVLNQNFHSESCATAGFSMDRMTWIKTNFLWMMYRSGWATKPNQERILAIRITRDGFDHILDKAVISHSQDHKASKTDQVRLQWDPDHLPKGQKVPQRRAIQIGLRAQILHTFSKQFIISISDITEFVLEQRRNMELDLEKLETPLETIYVPTDLKIAEKIDLTLL